MSKKKVPSKPKRGSRPTTKDRTDKGPVAGEPGTSIVDFNAEYEDANRYFAEQDANDKFGSSLDDGPDEDEPESELPTSNEKVERSIWLLHEFDDYPRSESGRRQLGEFVQSHPEVSEQNLKDLVHARANLGQGDLKAGEAILRRALLELGHSKTVWLSQLPDFTIERALELLDHGLALPGSGRRIPLAQITMAQLVEYSRRNKAAKKHTFARHHLKWPESLIGHTKKLVEAWPHIEAQIPKPRKDVRQMLAMNLDEVLVLRTTLLAVLKEIERFLHKHGETGSFPGDLIEPAEVLQAVWQRIGRGHVGKIAGSGVGEESLKTEEELRRLLQSVLQELRLLRKAP